MTPVTAAALEAIFPRVKAERAAEFAPHLNAAMERFGIVTPERQAAFLAQVGHESAHLSALVENLCYSHADRIVLVFRAFDLNHNHMADAEELEFAAGFVGQPTKLANYVYANRNGNGDAASGDGYRYRGRGLFQTTGRANYLATSIALFGDEFLILNPDTLATPKYAALSAAYYFERNRCNDLADEGNFREMTRVINGGYTGYNERLALLKNAQEVLV